MARQAKFCPIILKMTMSARIFQVQKTLPRPSFGLSRHTGVS